MEFLNWRRVVHFTICLALIVSLAACGRQETEPVREEAIKPVETELTKAEAEEEKRLALIKEKQAELANTEWQISVTPLSGEVREPRSDTLRFVDRRVASETFEAKGYPASNYTLRVHADGTVIWETMQTKEGGMVFWRGERRDDVMRGVISKHPKGREHEDFSFVSISSRKIE